MKLNKSITVKPVRIRK